MVEVPFGDDIDAVLALGRSRIGADHVDAQTLSFRLERQPDCLALARGSDDEIVAYTLLYALGRAAVDAVLGGEIIRGSMLHLDLFARPSGGAAIYIAAVVSLPTHKIEALDLLRRHLLATTARHARAEWLFARAATGDGNRLLRRFKFERLPPPSEIAARRIDDGLHQALGMRGATSRASLALAVRKLRQTSDDNLKDR